MRNVKSKHRAKIWKRATEYLLKTGSRRPIVNVGKVSRLATGENQPLFVPGKVLGGGRVTAKVTVGAFSFSSAAVRKIKEAGGEALPVEEFAKRYPDGRGVLLVGG